jgi:hypothetical protein
MGHRHGLRGAAAPGAVRGGVVPELQRHADHLVPGVERELRGHRAVHAAAHRDERAPGARLEPGVTRRRAERAVQGVSREGRGVEPSGRQSAQRVGDRPGAHERGFGQRCAADELDHGAAGRPCRRAAGGVEARVGDAIAVDPHGDADLVAAGSPARARGVRMVAQPAAPARGVEVVVERREVERHALSVVAGWGSAPACRCHRRV